MLIAWKNIMARKWSSVKVALSIFAMVIIMCIFTAYSVALGEETDRLTKSYRSAHNIIIETNAPLSDTKITQASNIDGIGEISEIAICRNTDNLRGLTFAIDGQTYQCNHDYYDGNLNFGADEYVNKMHAGDFAFYKMGENIVQSHHNEELGYRFKGEKSLLKGRDYFMNQNEIIISEYFVNELEELGFQSDLLDKQLTITINGKSIGVTIVGIMNKHFYQLTDTTSQQFVACKDSELYNYFVKSGNKFTYQTKMYLTEYKLKDKLIDDVKAVFILNANQIRLGSEYGLSMSTTVKLIASILNGIMATVGLGIISALVLNIMYSMRYMMKKKSNFYAIMQVYGMDKKKMFTILFCEMFLLSIFSSIVAYAVSYGLVYLLDYLLSSMVGIGVFFGWVNFLVTFAIAVLFTLVIVIFVCLINYSLYYKRSTSKMLRSTMEN